MSNGYQKTSATAQNTDSPAELSVMESIRNERYVWSDQANPILVKEFRQMCSSHLCSGTFLAALLLDGILAVIYFWPMRVKDSDDWMGFSLGLLCSSALIILVIQAVIFTRRQRERCSDAMNASLTTPLSGRTIARGECLASLIPLAIIFLTTLPFWVMLWNMGTTLWLLPWFWGVEVALLFWCHALFRLTPDRTKRKTQGGAGGWVGLLMLNVYLPAFIVSFMRNGGLRQQMALSFWMGQMLLILIVGFLGYLLLRGSAKPRGSNRFVAFRWALLAGGALGAGAIPLLNHVGFHMPLMEVLGTGLKIGVISFAMGAGCLWLWALGSPYGVSRRMIAEMPQHGALRFLMQCATPTVGRGMAAGGFFALLAIGCGVCFTLFTPETKRWSMSLIVILEYLLGVSCTALAVRRLSGANSTRTAWSTVILFFILNFVGLVMGGLQQFVLLQLLSPLLLWQYPWHFLIGYGVFVLASALLCGVLTMANPREKTILEA